MSFPTPSARPRRKLTDFCRVIATKTGLSGPDDIAVIEAIYQDALMRKNAFRLIGIAVHLIGLIFTFGFLVFGNQQGWPILKSLSLLVLASIPIGLALLWLKLRLEKWARGGS